MSGNGTVERAIQQAAMAQAQQAAPELRVASPLNDVQLVCLMACHMTGDAKERVATAMEIMVEAIVRAKDMPGMIEAKKALRE